jgi:hypothetical protein
MADLVARAFEAKKKMGPVTAQKDQPYHSLIE